MKKILKFLDKFEDRVRARLSRYPIVYALIGAASIVLFYRGVWLIADETPFLSNPYTSLLISIVIMLVIGLLVSSFVGDSIVLSGLRRGKKITEKNMEEIEALERISKEEILEEKELVSIKEDIKEIKHTLADIKRIEEKR